jgi:hypothetical protein
MLFNTSTFKISSPQLIQSKSCQSDGATSKRVETSDCHSMKHQKKSYFSCIIDKSKIFAKYKKFELSPDDKSTTFH